MFFMKRIVYINSTTLHLNDDKYIIFSSIVSLGHKFELGLSEIGCTEYIFEGRGATKSAWMKYIFGGISSLGLGRYTLP